jgi:co-chaperonin GroES (HSP10)
MKIEPFGERLIVKRLSEPKKNAAGSSFRKNSLSSKAVS